MSYLLQPEPQIVVEDVFFQGGSYRLHGEFAYPETETVRGCVVIAGPHPLLGGNMRNNVVRSLGDSLARQGLATLRFDYRGVGRSEGPAVDIAKHMAEFWQTSHAPDEIDLRQDVQGAVDFLQQAVPSIPLAAIGYSFGCALLPLVRPRGEFAAMILIAPTVSKHDYISFRTVTCPMLVVTSEDDFVADGLKLDAWYSSLTMPRELIQKRCDNHFFRGHENWLVDNVINFWMPAESDDK